MTISSELQRLREQGAYSVRQVSRLLKIHERHIRRIESGEIKEPTFDDVMRLCKFYHITPNQFARNAGYTIEDDKLPLVIHRILDIYSDDPDYWDDVLNTLYVLRKQKQR